MSKVVRKHENSKHCFICGIENDKGLKAEFFEIETGELACVFMPSEKYQGYPGVLHGGISAAVLDELIGRAINTTEHDKFAVTTNLELKYKKPVPYGVKLTAIAKVTRNTRLIYEGEGTLYDDKGNECITAKGKYMKIPHEKFSANFDPETDWFLNAKDSDPDEIKIIDKINP